MQYAALFLTAFLAATLIPLPSELPLALLVRKDHRVVLAVLVATLGNYLGACTTYALGRGLFRRRAHASKGAGRALTLFRRYGPATLALSWVPVIGDAIVGLAGAARIHFGIFSVWTIAGKAARYAAVSWIASRG